MKKQTIIALLLALIFIALPSSHALAANTQAAYAKISPDLLNAFAESSGRLPVIAWLEDKSTEEYQSIVASIPEPIFSEDDNASVYSLKNIEASELSDEQRLMQIEQMQNYVMQKRQIAQAVYLADNNVVAQEFESELDEGEIVYISRYSSLIVLNITFSEAIDIASNNFVTKLDYSYVENESYMASSRQTIDAHTMENIGETAEGIKIGILELALPNLNSPYFGNFDTTKITCYNPITQTPLEYNAFLSSYISHAEKVGSVIFNPTYGVAKDIEHVYYGAGNDDISRIKAIEWMLDSGVNVINNCTGINTTSHNFETQDEYNTYTFVKWLDHIAYNHSVHYVIASGNSGAEMLNRYAMAYNVIAVGGIDDMNTASRTDDEIWNNSSYNSVINTNFAFKPDICASGGRITFPGVSSTQTAGTSYATPQVTGIVAILCSYKPQLMTKQALMKSILMNSVATQTDHRYDTTDVFGDDSGYRKYGAGIVNAYNAKLQIDSGNYINTTMSANTTTVKHNIGTIQAGQTVSITLVFLKRVRIRSGSHEDNPALSESELPRINLHVGYADAPAHVMYLKSNDFNYNNAQRIIFTAPATDEYEITLVKLGGDSTYETIYAVSWMVDTNNLH